MNYFLAKKLSTTNAADQQSCNLPIIQEEEEETVDVFVTSKFPSLKRSVQSVEKVILNYNE